jgi:hypothetical protein
MKLRSSIRRAARGESATPGLRRVARTAKPGIAVTAGRLVGVGPTGEAYLDLPARGLANLPARSMVTLTTADVGAEALVTFVDGDPARPVVVGLLRDGTRATAALSPARTNAIVDGERILLTGEKEVVLRCGKASIALSADGSVVIKGARLLASASGLHRIRGGAVQIN